MSSVLKVISPILLLCLSIVCYWYASNSIRLKLKLSENWAEPYTNDELAIDRKKIEEVSSWLSDHVRTFFSSYFEFSMCFIIEDCLCYFISYVLSLQLFPLPVLIQKNKCGILLITGPTGSGKTVLVKCLARSLGFEIREWITPLDRDYQNGNADSILTLLNVSLF